MYVSDKALFVTGDFNQSLIYVMFIVLFVFLYAKALHGRKGSTVMDQELEVCILNNALAAY